MRIVAHDDRIYGTIYPDPGGWLSTVRRLHGSVKYHAMAGRTALCVEAVRQLSTCVTPGQPDIVVPKSSRSWIHHARKETRP
ncbi:MAG: hypothetical protein ACJ78Q_08930 [Chloroflexia bacterium]